MIAAIEELRYMESAPNSLSGVQHIHDKSYEILFVIEGEGSMLIGNNLFPVARNTVFLTSKMEIHNITPTSEKYVRNIINLNGAYVEELALLTGSDTFIRELFSRRCIRLSDEEGVILKNHFSSIYNARKGAKNGITLLQNILSLFELLANTSFDAVSSLNNSVSKAVAFIDKNLKEELTLGMISDYVHLSKFHFSRIFRETTGMSPFRYITECRITKAKNLLAYTEESIFNIAEEVGFNTSSNFCNLFQKYEGISPSAFRALHQKHTG